MAVDLISTPLRRHDVTTPDSLLEASASLRSLLPPSYHMTPSGNRAFGGGQKRVGTDVFPLSPGVAIAHSLGPMGDVDDFEMSMLSELLMQDDELPSSLDVSDTAMSGSNDESRGSSSGDELSGSMSPTQETAKSKAKSAERKTATSSAVSTKQTDRKAKRRAQVAVSARRHRYRKKHEMLDLKKEVTDLTAELHSLRAKHQLLRPDGTGAEAEEYTMEQRHKRRKAEKMNEQLRRALVMQRRFFASVQAVVSNSPIANAQLNMCSLMHTFTHLGRTSHSRRRDYVALCTDSKTDLAIQILLRETDSMDFTGPPSFSTQLVPTSTPQKQIVTTVAAYTFDTVDLKSVFISACGGILGCGTEWPHYTTVSQYGEITDKPQGNILYGVSDTHYQHTTATTAQTSIVSVESRSLFYYRMGGNYGVLVWDFADQDDLHPVKDDTTIKRDLVGAAMVRRELCRDGVERVVCRSICTKVQTLPLTPTTPQVADYIDKTEQGAKMCGVAVYNHIRQHASQASIVSV